MREREQLELFSVAEYLHQGVTLPENLCSLNPWVGCRQGCLGWPACSEHDDAGYRRLQAAIAADHTKQLELGPF